MLVDDIAEARRVFTAARGLSPNMCLITPASLAQLEAEGARIVTKPNGERWLGLMELVIAEQADPFSCKVIYYEPWRQPRYRAPAPGQVS